MNDTKEEASATVAGREFHVKIVLGKKLNLSVFVEVKYCCSLWACLDLVIELVECVR